MIITIYYGNICYLKHRFDCVNVHIAVYPVKRYLIAMLKCLFIKMPRIVQCLDNVKPQRFKIIISETIHAYRLQNTQVNLSELPVISLCFK